MSKSSNRKDTNAASQSGLPEGERFARLLFRDGKNGIERKDVLRNTTLIGSARGCNIQLVSQQISYVHCIITLEADALRVRDLRSAAGTRVNGNEVTVCTLGNGDKLEVGPVAFLMETNLPERAELPAAAGEGASQEAGNAAEAIEAHLPEEAYARLVFHNKNDTEVTKNVLRHTTLIGSARGCNIQLLSRDVSLAHSVITLESGVLRVRDLRSQRGTRVNSVPVNVHALSDGDLLQVGRFRFRFETNLQALGFGPADVPAETGLTDAARQPAATNDSVSPFVVPAPTDDVLTSAADQQSEQTALRPQVADPEKSPADAPPPQPTEVVTADAEGARAPVQRKQSDTKAKRKTIAEREKSADNAAELDDGYHEIQQRRDELRAEQEELETHRAELQADMDKFHAEQKQFYDQLASAETHRLGVAHAKEPQSSKSAEDVAIAKTLVVQGIISRFQADWFLEGCFRGFFIDDYKVLDLLDAGGMGWLYTAENPASGDKAVLKVLPKNHADDAGMLTRFELEARAGVRLKHPNIIRTFKIDQTDDVYYVLMELVEGINLCELIGLQGRIAWPQACSLVAQAAAGLECAHTSGMIHRDVKPANLLVQHDGGLKILDFGLALLEKDEDEFSLAMIFGHDCLGTADYIAPEQSLDSYSVGPNADIYSLGGTLYFALTGQVPFPAKTISAKLDGHRSKQPKSVKKFAPDIPDELAAIVEKMMAKRPEQRFQSAADVSAVLAPFVERQRVFFDFPSVLSARAAVARQRLRLAAKNIAKDRDSHVLAGSQRHAAAQPPPNRDRT
jgi:serine/threonine-protein kinase